MKTNELNDSTTTDGVKSSKNRKERRADKAKYRKAEKLFKKDFSHNNEWTRLKTEVYANACSIFYPVESLVKTLQTRKDTLSYMTADEADVFVTNCKMISRDIVSYKKELEMIYAIHSDKDGSCDMEDWSLMLEITEKYYIFTSNFNAVISPVYDHLVDLLHVLEHRRYIAENQDSLVDENITDGEFTEVKEETTHV